MKKGVYLFLFVSLFLLGCSQSSVKLEKYDHSELEAELEEEGIRPKLPTKFPVAITEYKQRIPPHPSTIYETSFTGENRERFLLTISSAGTTYNDFEREDITINGNDGFYVESVLPGPSVHWDDGDYHYIFQYEMTETDEETKELMIKLAESFE